MLHNRFTIGLCCMAMHKEPIKTLLDSLTAKISVRDDCLLLIYHCFDDMSTPISDSSHAASVFDAVNYDCLDVMIVYQSDEKQNDIFKKICLGCHEHGVPVISIDVPFDNAFFVSFGYGEAFGKIVEHVITEHNCKKIKHMAGIKGNDFSQTRIDCCAEIMAKHGLTFTENDIMYGEFWDFPTRLAMDNFFESGEEMPDAFICANDAMAMTVCSKLTEKGFKVPEDVIVTGFDGISLEKYHVPRLTTAKRDYNELTDTVLKIIEDIKANPALTPYHTELSYTPVFSESCGCVKHHVSETGALFTEFIKNYDYMRGFEERTNRMSNMIAFNPTLKNACSVLREYTFEGSRICVSEDFIHCTEPEALSELQDNFPDELTLLLVCENDERRSFEGTVFSPSVIMPDLENCIPGNNTIVITSLYTPQFIIGYLITYYVISEVHSNHLYTYNMALNRCLENIRLHEHMQALNNKMEFMFTHDQLTKILNRYGFYKNFTDSYTSCKGKSVFIASVDLNDMKYINDTFGHSEGDEALRITANSLLIAASKTDENIICSRFGGDEFVVALICGDSAEEKAEIFRRNFIAAIEAFNAKNEKNYKVSASIGISCSPLCDIKNVEELIERADRMMYTDKARHKRRPKGV